MTDHAAHDAPSGGPCGCDEYLRLSRRNFLAASGVAALASAAPAWLPRVALAESHRSSQRDVIVSVYLRGASDGLTMVVPFGDPNYYTARPSLNVAPPDANVDPSLKATSLDGFFGLPAAMLPLLPAYQSGQLLFVHATGSHDPSRSHFDAQRFMEVGKAQDPTLGTGWLGRHLASVTPMSPNAILRAVGISTGLMRTLVGAPDTLPIPNLDTFDIAGSSTTLASRRAALQDLYGPVADPVHAAAMTTLQTIDLLNTINFAGYAPSGGAVYPTGNFGTAFKSTAALLKAQIGVEAVAIDLGGWDTHANQGIFTGTMAGLMSQLAQALAAFHADMNNGPVQPSHIVTVLSEFGRRVAQNGSAGTDHGHGNAALIMGNAVTGGRVLANWPGLGPGQLYQGLDLAVTIDYRDVLAEIVQERLGGTDLSYIFPGHTPAFQGVVS
ncbi:MAG: hypothetical protein HBSAPP03_07870 [Phycisphaerae bacterium]|nr:MAG: hypothetical protein HBSAPP03_07870 [Phycisphaerae bacterium]